MDKREEVNKPLHGLLRRTQVYLEDPPSLSLLKRSCVLKTSAEQKVLEHWVRKFILGLADKAAGSWALDLRTGESELDKSSSAEVGEYGYEQTAADAEEEEILSYEELLARHGALGQLPMSFGGGESSDKRHKGQRRQKRRTKGPRPSVRTSDNDSRKEKEEDSLPPAPSAVLETDETPPRPPPSSATVASLPSPSSLVSSPRCAASPSPFVPGSLVECRYDADGLWYPALVGRVEGEDEQKTADVVFLWYNNRQTSPLSLLREPSSSSVQYYHQLMASAQQQEEIAATQEAGSVLADGTEMTLDSPMLDRETWEEEEGADGEEEVELQTSEAVNQGVKRDRKPSKRSQCSRRSRDQDIENPYASVHRKYWSQRYRFFHKFDDGVQLDAEGWFSVTPETIAKHLAARCACSIIVDAFTGCGGNAVQFASYCSLVLAIDLNPERLHMARHNARIYGVEDKIEFILGDATKILPRLRADVVFLSPPWGGPEYINAESYDPQSMLQVSGLNGGQLLSLAFQAAENVVYLLPRNTDEQGFTAMGGPLEEVEEQYLDGKLKTITAYYGPYFQHYEEPIIAEGMHEGEVLQGKEES